MIRNLIFTALLIFAPAAPVLPQTGPDAQPSVQQQSPQVFDAEVVASYPHDDTAFTQGLLWYNEALYESTGREGQSEIRKTELSTGETLSRRSIPNTQFGEGLAEWRGELISLTWKSGNIHRWRATDLVHVRSDTGYPYEGWGLARLDNQLIASDGGNALKVLDPEIYAVIREIPVTINGRPLTMLNELEVVDGLILANVWMTNFIVGIDPSDGVVRRVIDLTSLPKPTSTDRDAVLNGIAWDAKRKRLFVTGKLWAQLYEIRLIERVERPLCPRLSRPCW